MTLAMLKEETGGLTIERVPRSMLHLVWDQAEPFVAKAIEESAGETTPEHVKQRILASAMSLLVASDSEHRIQGAFCVNHILYDNYSAVRVVLAAGEPMSDWLPSLVAYLEQWCATMGAEQIELFGRPGFQKALKGWANHEYTVMVRKVPYVRG